MQIGILFPGQGTQHVGMGKNWYESERLFQESFEEASSCLSFNIAKLCFASHADELRRIRYAQVSIFVVSCALYRVLRKYTDIQPVLLAGHSSGEYTAVHASGALSFVDALYLINKRAQLTEEATNHNPGAMIAVLGLSDREVRAICATCDRPRSDKRVAQVAVYNGPEQTVISCTQNYVASIQRAITASGGRSMRLPVDGGFHSRLMKNAQKSFVEVLKRVTFSDPLIPFISNITTKPLHTAAAVTQELEQQMCKPVYWWESMRKFASCDLIIQVGPGKTFAKLLRRHWPEKRVLSFDTQEDLEPIIRVLNTRRPVQE